MAAMKFIQCVCTASCISYMAKFKTVGEIDIYLDKNNFIAIYYATLLFGHCSKELIK